ncbi:Alpha-D-ribose 1-methylphosphonate 5-triphosphate synthase subunit PhnL [Pseudoruegeria aquimaris]|uniref:Alpha-D-ribose 1-methylphosphonate 5-triphosphate synthase subunit PhnL n=1 Tax=Pseudoruegeria aquimaris TaxID=393663 RepID=A0A1Y5RQB0_9RHOB|nr:ATP-binding cassette domain-containing protein [Pseudoruegeria aquimaris]SLN19956.1 Alpha-D-ribose 1-methylphosphonate 5-triphosphate synthase subunit PhnL [Pseudoruegeria aquimaris]
MTRVLDIQALSKGFSLHHLGQDIAAFDAISFSLDAGEFVLIKGINGAGKSTLLRTIYRSYLPRGGAVVFHSAHGPIDLARAADVDIAHLRRTEIGFVTQFLNARPRVSAEALVAEPLRLAGESADAALHTARGWLSTFGVKEELWQAYPSTFSGGEQQKVNLARALILPRKLILLDEPTASLDAGARAALVARLAELKENGAAMLGVFHHPGDVADLIDRVIDLTPDAAPEEDREDVAV